MSVTIDEIAADVYRLPLYVPEIDLQFNHFLVKDDEPLNDWLEIAPAAQAAPRAGPVFQEVFG